MLTKDRSAQEWADAYIPYIVDAAKRGPTLTPEFIRAWASVGMANPRTYLDAYVELMRPYWTFGKAEGYRYGIGLSTDFGVWEDFTLKYSDSLRKGYLSQFGQEKSKLFLWPQRSESWVDKHLPWPLRWVFYDVLFNRGLPLWALLLGGIVSTRKRDYLIVAAPRYLRHAVSSRVLAGSVVQVSSGLLLRASTHSACLVELALREIIDRTTAKTMSTAS